LEERLKLEKDQHEYIKRSIEDDADREILEIKVNYEKRVKTEKDLNVELKGEISVLKRKIQTEQKEVDDQKFQVALLKGCIFYLV
jgi:cilia- and flagella-associated protein 57